MLADEYERIRRALTAPGAPFHTLPITIGGHQFTGWRQAPRDLRSVLETSASAYADRPFIVFGDERSSHAEHFAQVARCANILRDRYGVAPGDRVAIAMRNLPEWSIAFWAIVSMGAVAVSINAWMTGREMTYCIADSRAKVLIADEERLDRLVPTLDELPLEGVMAVRADASSYARAADWKDVLATASDVLPDAEIDPDDDATILYTSGTTGHPKGALGSHRASCHTIINNCFFSAVEKMARGQSSDAVELIAGASNFLLGMPLFHGAGCQYGLVLTLFTGGKLVMMHRWTADMALELIDREHVTALGGAPTHYIQLIDRLEAERDRPRLGSIQTAFVGGASPPSDLPARMRTWMPNAAVGTGYGQTECTQVAAMSSGTDYLEYPTSFGRALPVCDIRIVDGEDRPVPAGATGELLIRTPTIVKGYVNLPEQTEATFGNGWLRTGDLVHMDDQGRLYLDDRKKDMIKRAGENIYSIEVEQALYSHPDVQEAAVFGVPHPVLSEEPVAAVHLHQGSAATEEELRAHVAARLAKFKIPAAIAIHAEPLPRNANGKILKRELRAAMIARQGQTVI